jgi:elongation factor G
MISARNREVGEIPEELKDAIQWKPAQKWSRKIAELDDDLTMKFLEAQEISVDELKAAFAKASFQQ